MKHKISEQEAQEQIRKFFEMKLRKKQIDQKFDKAKKSFYSAVDSVVEDFGEGQSYVFHDTSRLLSRSWKLTKSVPVKVIFDPVKLLKKLGKKLASRVVVTTATIDDYSGLVKYLKSCGVDSKVFKSFVTLHKEVDKDAIEQLEAIGEIDKEDLAGTFEATVGKPSFRISMNVEEEEEEED